MAKVMLSQCDTPSKLRGIEDFTSKHICELAVAGDHMALKIIDRFGDYLGRAMSYISCTVDPDVFIIGGGMSKAGNIVTDDLTGTPVFACDDFAVQHHTSANPGAQGDHYRDRRGTEILPKVRLPCIERNRSSNCHAG